MTGDWSQLFEVIPSVCSGNNKTACLFLITVKHEYWGGGTFVLLYRVNFDIIFDTSHGFLSVVVLVPVASILSPKPSWTCRGAAKKPEVYLRVSSEGLSSLITEMRFLFPIVSEDRAMKELTQFLTASHKRQLTQKTIISSAHVCAQAGMCAWLPEDPRKTRSQLSVVFHWWKNWRLIDI